MTADGSRPRRLTWNAGVDADPTWSSDGRRIAFESKRGESSEIYVMNADGGGQRRLTREGEDGGDPAWAPDGRRIAFVGDNGVYVIRADGLGLRRLTRSRDDRFPGWVPAGRNNP
jgi:TolB protein